MEEDLPAEELKVVLIENQPEIISKIHSMLTEIKECRLKVHSSHQGLAGRVEAELPDLVLLSHDENAPAMVSEIRERSPETYVIILLPGMQEDQVNEYIKRGAHGLLFKNQSFEGDFITTMKKAFARIVERKSSLVDSISRSSFFSTNLDMERLMLHVKTLQAGQTILHYKIVEPLGEGGMGEVYRAEDQKLRRRVAIKVLSPRLMRDPTARTRLMREAIAASALNHPNIITIYAIEEMEDFSFIAMEFVEGKSLYRTLKRGLLPLGQLLDLGAKVADALSVAHSAGLVHRDIKPGNIMISTGDQVKLLDFGLAKWMPKVEQDFSADPLFASTLTTMGAPVGTINYMSPEQTRGESLDTRTDIFSLGSVLYEAATGKTPFRGASILEIFHEIATSEPQPPSSSVPSLPQAFDVLISRAMAKKPEDRFASVSEFSEGLKKLKFDLDHSREPARRVVNSANKPTLASAERIFLVEDNEDNRDMLTRRLKRKGFDVLIAVNGRDALDRIPVEQPDLILMDISLPLVDGIEVSRRLKNSDSTKSIPIIALTAHAMAGDREKALAAGCDDYDTKPVDFERLLNKILHSLEKKKEK